MILSLTTEYGFNPHDLERLYKDEETKKKGCDGLELMESLDNKFNLNNYELTCWLPDSAIPGIKYFLSKNPNKKISSIHAYAPLREDFEIGNHPADYYNLSSCKDEKRKFAVTALKSTMLLAEQLGTKYIVVHAGFKERNKTREDNFDALRNSLDDCIEFSNKEKIDVQIGVENGLYPSQISVSIPEIKKLKEFYPYAGLWLDSGHAFVNKSSDLYGTVEQCQDVLIGFHLHNNNGKKDLHSSLDRGKINFNKVLTPFKEKILSNQIPVILELYNYRSNNTDEDVKKSLEIIKNIIYSNQ